MKVILVRHGKDDDRYRGGWSGLDLTLEGMKQAEKLARYLKENQDKYCISQIISSDLRRAVTTADYIGSELGLPVQLCEKLREMNNGDLAGMSNEEALKKYPGLFFSSLKMDEPYPNGESPTDFFRRIKKWFGEFCAACQSDCENKLIVTHGGVINIIYHLVNEIEWSNKGCSYKASNCGIHILNMDKMKFETENRTDFLTF